MLADSFKHTPQTDARMHSMRIVGTDRSTLSAARRKGGKRKGGKGFEKPLQRKKGFDWLLRRKGGRVSMVLIGCCGGRDEIGLLGPF